MAGINNSVVVVTFNSKGPLLAMLRRLRLNEATGMEVIIVDSGSFEDDGLAEAVKQYPTIKPIKLDSNRGFFAAANKGIDAAEGDVVVVCHADVLTDVHSLAELADQLREAAEKKKTAGQKTGAAVPRLMQVDGEPQGSIGTLPTLMREIVGAFFPTVGLAVHEPKLDHVSDHEWARFVCVALHIDTITTIGKFDEKFFLYGGDADYCARLHVRDIRVQISKTVRMTHAGAGINTKELPDHLKRILRNDQRRYADKFFGGFSKSIVHLAETVSGWFGRDG